MNTTRQQKTDRPTQSKQDAATDFGKLLNRSVSFTPFQEAKAISLTAEEAREIIAVPTKSGKLPTDRQIMTFLKLCEFRKLNPWVKDVFLLGYDTQDGPQFSPIVSHQALQKRADAHPAYRGIESGLILWDRATKTQSRIAGDVAPTTLDIIGGWAKVHRKDRDILEEKTARMSAYNRQQGHWKTDPGWMICKCAEAKALRAAFPNETAGMISVEEFGSLEAADTLDNQAGNRSMYPAANSYAINPAGATSDGIEPVTSEQIVFGQQEDSEDDPVAFTFSGVGCDALKARLAAAENLGQVTAVEEAATEQAENDDERAWVRDSCRARREAIGAARSESVEAKG